jgi:hypothetical protein
MTHNPYQSPAIFPEPAASESDVASGITRLGNLLFVTHDAQLPQRCVKCNTTEQLVPRELVVSYLPAPYRHWNLLFPLPTNRKWRLLRWITLHYWICERHRRARITKNITICLSLFVVLVALAVALQRFVFYALSLGDYPPSVKTWTSQALGAFQGVFPFLFLLMILKAISSLTATRVTEYESTISGAGEAFLATFPERATPPSP